MMNVNGYKVPIWLVAFIGISLVLAVASTVLAVRVSQLKIAELSQAPISYDRVIYQPSQRNLCPGDFLEIEYRLSNERAPLILEVYETWARAVDGVNVVVAFHPMYSILDRVHDRTKVQIAIRVPDLPAGEYSFIHAAITPTSAASPAFFSVPFNVPSGCE